MKESCGCCEGLDPLTPLSTANRPGLEVLTYRVGTHATFLETMKARLSSSRFPSLANLKTRDANDPAIALLDAWATVADVLTFYQERIANEGYLRTATERRSVLELARLIGYTLRPGVAATVFPAFTMEIGYNTKDSEIPAGTRIQSLPGPSEMPQFFETAEKIAARTDWNEIKPRLTRPLIINRDNAKLVETVYLKGIATNLRAGDPLLLTFRFETTDINPDYPELEPVLRKVAIVEPQPVENLTKVTLQPNPLGYKDFLEAFRQVVIKYSIPDKFCIDERTPDAVLIIGILAKLVNLNLIDLDKIPPPISASEFLKRLTASLLDLSSSDRQGVNEKIKNPLLLAVFELKKYSVESIWLNRLIAELEKLIRAWYLFLNAATQESDIDIDKSEVLSWANWLNKINESSPQQILDWYIAWLLYQYAKQEAKPYEIRLITTSDELPSARRSLIVVKKIDASYRFRIFDTTGKQLDVDKGENESLPAGLSQTLREAFKTQSSGQNLSDQTKIELKEKIIFLQILLCGPIKIPKTIPSFDSLSEIVDPLSKSPSIPPANRFQLARNISKTFNSDSDLRSRLVETLDLILGPTLYQVLASEDRLPALPLKTLEAMRVKAALFGHNAPLEPKFNTDGRFTGKYDEWELDSEDRNSEVMTLDALYDQIQVGDWVIIVNDQDQFFYRVVNAQATSVAKYGISGRVTKLHLEPLKADQASWLPAGGNGDTPKLTAFRGITIYTQGEDLDVTQEPLTSEPICGKTIELGTIYEGLKAGRWLIISGERVDVPNTKVSELVMLAGVQNRDPNPPGAKPYSTLILSTKLAYVYKRDTVTIYGNVVKATHGETRLEVLGSGDGSQTFQHFPLRQPPLTYLAAPTPSGAASTLQLRVNDVLWHETDSLAGLKPTDYLYITKTDDNGMTTVVFGNGENGARLPTGIENVRAVYRNGIGKAGNVKAEQISLLATRPLGLKGVINPLPATGGADRENRDRARKNAPLAVMSLDRLVSVQDYADFARTFAGVGKASALRLVDGNRQIVHVTIAGADDIPIDERSDLYRNLKRALLDFGDPNQPLQLAVRRLVLLIIAAKIRVLPDYQWESVEPQIRAALLDIFGFERRELGQSIWLSDVISPIQQIPGVEYVDVDLFDSVSEEDVRTRTTTEEERELLIDGNKVTIVFNQQRNNLAVKLDTLPTEPPKPGVDSSLAKIDPTTRIITPAQLAIFSPNVADTMILTELKS